MKTAEIVFRIRTRELRRERGWTQEELSRRSGVHRVLIADYERGARTPQFKTLFKLAAALQVSPLEILPPKNLAENVSSS